MLTIGKLGAGQERYYLDKVAEGAEDYYTLQGEAEGQWLGDLARGLGLDGPVEAEELTAMLTGHNPATGEPLGLRAVGGRGPVPGFDLTFSVPKSASLLWALGDKTTAAEISAAVDLSVHAALTYMEREACWTRRGADAEFVRGEGFLTAAFRHRTSRAGDPQLHVHALIANATRGPDGRWTRLYHPAIYDHAKTAGYLFEAQFRYELTERLGVRWQEARNGIAEIEGFADDHLRAFSTRRQQILEAAGPDASARSRQVATLATRTAKEEISQEALRERWEARAQEIGLEVGEVAERWRGPRRDRTPDAWQVGRAVTAGASHFDRRDVVQAVAGYSRNGTEAAEVERVADEFLASEEVVRLGGGAKGERFTTVRVWEIERKALATVEEMKAGGPLPAGEGAPERVLAARPGLKEDQRELVTRLLTDPEGIAVVIGEAGSGKTYALVAAAEGWAGVGVEVRAAAPTWRAANVMRAEGLRAQSVASLLAELDNADYREGLDQGSVLIVDEAGMVDSATLARLIDHANRAEARLALVGDPEQLAEIEAGGLFRAIAERSQVIHLDDVIRHRFEAEREGAKRIREGEGREALELFRSEGRVTVATDADARRELMVADWHQAHQGGEDAVMVAKRNAEVEQLNELARMKMREAGQLGPQEVEVGGRPFAAGDQVITRVNDRRRDVYNRERWEVADVDAATGSVQLRGIDQDRAVTLDADYLAKVNPHSGDPALQHAYAITTYSAQGTTVDRAYLAADPSMDKQELYVATSRSRGETFIYATPEIHPDRAEIGPLRRSDRDRLDHIAEAAERDRAQLAAHEVARLATTPSTELARRRDELRSLINADRQSSGRRVEVASMIKSEENFLARVPEQRERAERLPRRARRAERERIEQAALRAEDRRHELLSEAATLPAPSEAARFELAAVDRVLEERRDVAVIAARLSAPRYLAEELGERPSDLEGARLWDRAAGEIERYRQEHGITDPDSALGIEPSDRSGRDSWHEAHRAQQHLEHQQAELHLAHESIDRGLDIGL